MAARSQVAAIDVSFFFAGHDTLKSFADGKKEAVKVMRMQNHHRADFCNSLLDSLRSH